MQAHRYDCPSCFERLTSLVRHSKQVTLQRNDSRNHTTEPLWMKIYRPAASQRLSDFLGLPHSLDGRAAASCPSCQRVWHWCWRSNHEEEGILSLERKVSPSLAHLLAHTNARKAGAQSASKFNPKRYASVQRTKASPPQEKWPVDPRDSPPFEHKMTPQAVIKRNRMTQEHALHEREKRARERFSAKARALGTTPQVRNPPPRNKIRDLLVRYAGRFFTAPYEPMSRWDTLPEYMPAEKKWSLEEIAQKHDLQSDMKLYWVSWQNEHWKEANFKDVHTFINFHHFKGHREQNVLVLETTWVGLIAIPQVMGQHSQEIVLVLPQTGAGYLIAN